ncbi:MAG: SLC13 family permease [bacterium]
MPDLFARWLSLLTFLCVYVLFVVRPRQRTWVALAGAFVVVGTGSVSPQTAFWSINWNVMGIFWGMLVISELFMRSGVPAFLAERMVQSSSSSRTAIIYLFCLSSGISIFLENVAVVLLLAPVAFQIVKRLDISPVPVLIGIAVCSNLQGTATLIGDPPSMLLGSYAKMDFLDFFVLHGKPSIFFAVELGAVAGMVVLFIVLGRGRPLSEQRVPYHISSLFPAYLLIGLIVVLAASSFIDLEFEGIPGLVCIVSAVLGFCWHAASTDEGTWKMFKGLDWDTTAFLLCVFVLVGSLSANGWLDSLARGLVSVVGTRVLVCYVVLVVLSVMISAFVDNVPFLVAMLPVTKQLAASANIDPTVLYFGLLLGASVGGNITPIGASANIVAVGQLRQQGYPMTFWRFVKIGLPFTVVAVSVAAVFAWIVFGP